MISLLVLAYMVHEGVHLVLLLSLAWVFLGVIVALALPYHLMIAMVLWGSLISGDFDCQMVLELGEVVSGKFPRA